MARFQIGPKNCFVIFVVLFDEFDRFGQTFGVINVSIDKIANSFIFYGVMSVFNIICPETILSCQGTHHNYFLVTKMFAKKKSAAIFLI
jgi:hypothetical protein